MRGIHEGSVFEGVGLGNNREISHQPDVLPSNRRKRSNVVHKTSKTSQSKKARAFLKSKTGTHNVLATVNRENRERQLTEIMMTGQSLNFLSHPGWGNIFYNDLVMLPPSKAFEKMKFVVLKTDIPCKFLLYCFFAL